MGFSSVVYDAESSCDPNSIYKKQRDFIEFN